MLFWDFDSVFETDQTIYADFHRESKFPRLLKKNIAILT